MFSTSGPEDLRAEGLGLFRWHKVYRAFKINERDQLTLSRIDLAVRGATWLNRI